ncbi:MAG: hypothetical protein PHV55_00350 [Candidatus Omnitrophica bacterium]|nr:hypothetical protein [Candidatus Omnitrophota bacterium]
MKSIRTILTSIVTIVILAASFYFFHMLYERFALQEIIKRLSADSRVAEVVVSDIRVDPATKKTYTTIKFLEYDAQQKPLMPQYFTFSGNIIQFQSMVIRFDDFYVQKAHPLKGKSAYLFLKAFALTDEGAETFPINKVNEVPSGYALARTSAFEKKLWRQFWDYALNPLAARDVGIKNAQIEAPGTRFVPGMLYTIKIEHDGGLRIDIRKLPGILQGEKISF